MTLRVDNLSTHPTVSSQPRERQGFALRGITFEVKVGRRVALVGPNGSGKSTLLRVLVDGRGIASGEVRFDRQEVVFRDEPCADGRRAAGAGNTGEDLASDDETRPLFAFVGQDPEAGFVTSTVMDEVCFALCNCLADAEEVRERARRSLAACGIGHLGDMPLECLSGGQKQLVSLAAALALHPWVLLLDEPCSMLDGVSQARLRKALDGCSHDMAVIETTHRLDDVLRADEVLAMTDGELVWQGTPGELAENVDLVGKLGLRRDGVRGAASRYGRTYAEQLVADGWEPVPEQAVADSANADQGQADRLAAVSCSYRYASRGSGYWGGRRAQPTGMGEFGLKEIDLFVEAGALTLLVGASGSGKTTLACLLAGLFEPESGRVLQSGRAVVPGSVGMVFQRAEDQLFKPTVLEDVAFGPHNLGYSRVEAAGLARDSLAAFGMDDPQTAQANPQRLSGGQKRRVGLAGVLAMGTRFVVFDEPTVGLDAFGVSRLLDAIEGLLGQGRGVLVSTHEPQVFYPLARRAYVLDKGALVGSYAR